MADVDPALQRQILNVPLRQREAIIHDGPDPIPPGGGRSVLTAEAIAAYRTKAVPRRAWRLTQKLRGIEAVRRRYEAAGVKIDILKVDGLNDLKGAELDYAFHVGKALGVRALSCEFLIPATPKLAAAATKHRRIVALHNHLPVTPAMWEDAFRLSPYLGANVDIGHFFAGQHLSPAAFLEKHHDRVPHIHVKDKTPGDVAVELGQGGTPIRDVLRLIRDRRWPIDAVIEYDVKLSAGADRAAALRQSIDYCRSCLLS